MLSLKAMAAAMAAATVTGMTAVMAEGTTAAATVTGITAVMAEETTAAAMETEMAVTAAETEAQTVAATAAAMMADMEMEVAKGTETRAEAEAEKHQILEQPKIPVRTGLAFSSLARLSKCATPMASPRLYEKAGIRCATIRAVSSLIGLRRSRIV